jgi:PHD/YefM family antitoxin component YafN of YafNO toxin-antitoxin module
MERRIALGDERQLQDSVRQAWERGDATIVEDGGRELAVIVPIDEYRRLMLRRMRLQDMQDEIRELHAMVLAELDDRELTPADEIIEQMREERSVELTDLY